MRDWDEYICQRCGNKTNIEMARNTTSDFDYDGKQA